MSERTLPDKLTELERSAVELAERVRRLDAAHADVHRRNQRLYATIRQARIRAEFAADKPYYLGTGHDAGEHWGVALKEVVAMLKRAEDDE